MKNHALEAIKFDSHHGHIMANSINNIEQTTTSDDLFNTFFAIPNFDEPFVLKMPIPNNQPTKPRKYSCKVIYRYKIFKDNPDGIDTSIFTSVPLVAEIKTVANLSGN